MMNRELEDLIAQHLGGHLDAPGQRRLAEMLAASAEARQTWACYLRLEGAAIKLGSARQLSGEEAATGWIVEPETESPAERSLDRSPSRRGRFVWLAVAVSVVAALTLGIYWRQSRLAGSAGELDLLAENWLYIQENPLLDELTPADQEPPAPFLAASEAMKISDAEEPQFSTDFVAPPSWMMAAAADLAGERSNPDAS